MSRPPRRTATRAKINTKSMLVLDDEEEVALQLQRDEVMDEESDAYIPPSETKEISEDELSEDSLHSTGSNGPSSLKPRSAARKMASEPPVRPRRSRQTHTNPDQSSEILSETENATSKAAKNPGARLQTKSTRFGKRRHADGSKEDNLISLLGEHVSMDHALALRQSWGKEVRGPRRSLIQRFLTQENVCLSSDKLKATDQREVLVEDLAMLSAYIPAETTVNVEFILPGSLELSNLEMSTYNSRSSATNSNRSSTLFTGLSNRSLSWLRTRENERDQYLAVAGTPAQALPTPLFSLETCPGCIQIWRVAAQSLDIASNLEIVYAHDFGHTWGLKWCPAVAEADTNLGYLAGVFGDGTVRIWCVAKKGGEERPEPQFRRLTSPAYTLQVPDSGCVTIDWISDVQLAAGCMNGMVVVWDLAIDNVRPVSVSHPHTTYINNIVSCGPTARDVVATTSWDCDLKLSNIWRADAEFLPASRERMVSYAAAWSDFLNCAVVNEDQHNVRLVSMRGGYSANLASMTGTVTALATDPSHPFLAVGDASGCVVITNTCRKAMWKKHTQYRRRVYQLDWAMSQDKYRFTENFEIDEMTGKTVSNKTITTAIYPKQVGITCITWNSNAGFEGLLASCTEKFIRIDDMTINE